MQWLKVYFTRLRPGLINHPTDFARLEHLHAARGAMPTKYALGRLLELGTKSDGRIEQSSFKGEFEDRPHALHFIAEPDRPPLITDLGAIAIEIVRSKIGCQPTLSELLDHPLARVDVLIE